jgi:hypothetical protein
MAVNGSAASGRFVGAELVIDPIGTVFEPLEHSPAPFRSHLISGEGIGDFVMPMLDWNGYRGTMPGRSTRSHGRPVNWRHGYFPAADRSAVGRGL